MCNRYAGSEVDIQLGKAFFVSGSSFQLVENPEFIKYGKLRKHSPESYKEPTAETISGHVVNDPMTQHDLADPMTQLGFNDPA